MWQWLRDLLFDLRLWWRNYTQPNNLSLPRVGAIRALGTESVCRFVSLPCYFKVIECHEFENLLVYVCEGLPVESGDLLWFAQSRVRVNSGIYTLTRSPCQCVKTAEPPVVIRGVPYVAESSVVIRFVVEK